MKKFLSFFISCLLCLSFSSCITTAEAQTDGIYVSSDGVDLDIVITYGTPYYNAEGLLLYYIYRDLYYYPFYQGNRWYFRSYNRPLRYYRPVPRDFYHHRPNINHRHHHSGGSIHGRPHSWHHGNGSIGGGTHMRGHGNIGGNVHGRPHGGNGHFGGRR